MRSLEVGNKSCGSTKSNTGFYVNAFNPLINLTKRLAYLYEL